MRREWIEMHWKRASKKTCMSPSMRREWIEIGIMEKRPENLASPSMRREWIEIGDKRRSDRCRRESPSMRREWIEMLRHAVPVPASRVSLYAEGVD